MIGKVDEPGNVHAAILEFLPPPDPQFKKNNKATKIESIA